MKKITIISGTLNNNYKLSEEIRDILIDLGTHPSLLSLENYMFPLYTDKVFKEKKDEYRETVLSLINEMQESKGLIFCAPEYNGSIPPIVSNAISWISVSGEDWRGSFIDKIALIGTHSGGGGDKFFRSMKIQLEHLGSVVMPRPITVNNSSPLKKDSAEKILKQFINLI
ncbi:MAG: NADPH-dependent FMN reductase [Candidatus Marinimicrobia bacterium]|nr:NADPH-dependent FMN reductase [Candidatus Neomarinimicrobiota bacterium]|tara:strand:- start:12797 stop:13306 length:510 start_codon:yes stop_codon:yes gene_type:complete